MAGLSYSNETDWIYENPGDGSLLLVNATTLTDLPEEKSKTGAAFYQDSYDKCFDLPDTKEIWIKFDVFFGDDAWEVGDENWWIYGYYRRIDFEFWGDDDDLSVDLKNDVELNRSYTATLHVIFGTSESVIEIWIDDKSVYSYTGADSSSWTEFGKDYGNIHMTSEGARTFFSSIAISNVKFENDNTLTEFAGDLLRQLNKSESLIADTLRQTAINLTTFDILIKPSTKIFATYMPVPEKISADLFRKVTKNESIQVDTLRQIIQREVTPTVTKADTFRKITRYESFSADTIRIIKIPEKAQADTYRQVTATEIAIADLNRALREVASYDTFRKVTQKEKAIASTVIRVPHIWNYFIKPTLKTTKLLANSQSLVNTFKAYGITAVNITLSERTLSDNFTFQTAKAININDAVQGSLLNYHFNFLVEEITQTELIREVKGRYNQDDLLYTWFLLETPTYTFSNGQTLEVPGGHIEKSRDSDGNKTIIGVYPKAIEIISKVAAYFGLAADVHIDDFTPSNLQGEEKITYFDLLNSVFSWTSRVPQRQINLFIRGNTLHCIQRGKESSIFDISDLQHSRPTVNKKFNRVLCHNPNNNNNNKNDDDDNGYKFNGSISYRKDGIAPFQSSVYLLYTYGNGLLVSEIVTTKTEMFANSEGEIVTLYNHSTTTYSYTSYGKESYISSKVQNTTVEEQNMNTLETNTTEQKIKTTYGYSTDFNAQSQEMEVYLFHECEQTTKTEYQSGSKEREITKEIRDTYHAPVGNGWYAQTVYLNGILQGANLSQGKPGNSVSPYTVKQMQNTFRHYVIIQNPTANNENDELSNIIDDSFPISDTDIKTELNNALRWLHRKVQETVTVDLISPVNNGIPTINHIVDFTERIKLDGNEYFLVSNNISFTPRKLIQKLQLIRWY